MADVAVVGMSQISSMKGANHCNPVPVIRLQSLSQTLTGNQNLSELVS